MEVTQKKLYEHYIASKQMDRAEEILSVYPHFEDKPKKKSKKSKDEE
jgi:hypothetical protein